MMGFIRSTTVWVAGLFIVAFCIVATVTPNGPLQEAEAILLFALALGGMVAFTPDAWESVCKHQADLDPADVLTLAFWLLCAGIAASGLWTLIWRLAGQPAWMLNNDFNAFLRIMWIGGLTMMLSVPGLIGGKIPVRSRVRIIIWWAIGASLAAYVMAARPNLAPYVEVLRPLLEEPGAGAYGRNGLTADDLQRAVPPAD
jgi:hypothetical protein